MNTLWALRVLIDTEPANATRTDAEVLDWLMEPSGTYASTFINARSIMATIGAAAGATILEKLSAASVNNPAIKWALSFITADGIDIGHPETRTQLMLLASTGVITDAERDSLLAMAQPILRWQLATDWRDPVIERNRALHDINVARTI